MQLRQKALKLLSLRPRTEEELRKRLRRSTTKRKAVEKVIADLKRRNLLNDAEFCRWWLEQRLAFRPRSLSEIKAELRQKGVKREIVEQVLKEGRYDERKMVEQVILKRLKLKKESKKQLLAYLTRRGFSHELVISVIDEKGFFK